MYNLSMYNVQAQYSRLPRQNTQTNALLAGPWGVWTGLSVAAALGFW